jgi:hypothetical protein
MVMPGKTIPAGFAALREDGGSIARGIGWRAGNGVFGEAPVGFGNGRGDRFNGRSGEYAEGESVEHALCIVCNARMECIVAASRGSFFILFSTGTRRVGRGHGREFERDGCAGMQARAPGKTLEREDVGQGNEMLERRRIWEIGLKDRLEMVGGVGRVGENCLWSATDRRRFHLAGDARAGSDWG